MTIETIELRTPPIPRLVPDGIFDAFGWATSSTLRWRTKRPLDVTSAVTSDNPPGMVFLLADECTFLPRELASLHVPELVNDEATWALAPYAIDDATDGLHEANVEPRAVLQLATASLTGLFWALHDWNHFHNHGEFREADRPYTELQCDTAALVWIRTNLAAIGVDDTTYLELRATVRALGRSRFVDAGQALDEAIAARADALTI